MVASIYNITGFHFMDIITHIIYLVMIWAALKMIVWWALFGTFRLLFGKYTIKTWGMYTVRGLLIMAGMILLGLYIYYGVNWNGWIYLIVWGITSLVAGRVLIRELFSLGGLLKGDWNPFHPQLRFFGFDEEYIMDKLRMTKEEKKKYREESSKRLEEERRMAHANVYKHFN